MRRDSKMRGVARRRRSPTSPRPALSPCLSPGRAAAAGGSRLRGSQATVVDPCSGGQAALAAWASVVASGWPVPLCPTAPRPDPPSKDSTTARYRSC